MRKIYMLIMTFTLLAGLLSACGSNNKENTAASISSEAPLLEIDKLTAAYKELGEMLEGKKDVAEIDKAYKKNFQSNIQYIDGGIKEGDPRIDENITFVQDHAATKEMNYAQVEEAVEKGLNWYFYLQMKDLVNKQTKAALEAGDADKASELLEQAVQSYTAVLEPFVVKRDATFKTSMKETIAGAVIPKLREDVKTNNLADFNVHSQMLDKTLIKAFSLAAYSYAEIIPTLEKQDQAKAITEAYFLFLPVYSYLKGGSESDANAIKEAFGSGDPSLIDADKIKASLITCNTGKVKEYLEKSQQELSEGKTDDARVHAMEGVMFLAAQETFIGANYANVATTGEQYLKAIDGNNAEEAKKHGDAILASLAKL
jgi:tetratricopeptide (TPR) repeat protein